MLTQTWYFPTSSPFPFLSTTLLFCFQQEEVGAAAEELQGQAAGRGSSDGVIGSAEAQHRHGHLIGVPQGLVAFPVGLPTGGTALGLAEEGFLQLPQRAAAQQPGHVHHLGQGPHVPVGRGWPGWARGSVPHGLEGGVCSSYSLIYRD
uniref:Uncharacterized protein n=1 Tax=Calidris pygmaea TaxID=425635 RepID=A0A8C3JI87_9CHAR